MFDDLRVIIDVWSHPGYPTGILAGLIGAKLVLAVAHILRRRAFGCGLIFAAAVVVALTSRTPVDTDLLIRFGVLAAAGLLGVGAAALTIDQGLRKLEAPILNSLSGDLTCAM